MSKDTTIKSITFFHGIVNWCKYVEEIKDFRRTCGVCLVRIKLEQMDGDGLQLKTECILPEK